MKLFKLVIVMIACLMSPLCFSADLSALNSVAASPMGNPTNIFISLTLLSFLPFMVVAMTTFTRNIIVLSLMRQAIGLQQTPPNIVLISLSMFLTFFVMGPTLQKTFDQGVTPFLEHKIELKEAADQSWQPFRAFMVRQTREADIKLIYELAKEPLPSSEDALSPVKLIPAFMLSELKTAFQIGFVLFLPFLIIDLVVASILMALGMIMVPPITISMPIKIMLFLLIDGWGLLVQTLVRSVN